MTSREAASSTATAINTPAAAVGFIGLGDMGRPMAMNLLRAGHRVVGLDIDPVALSAAGVEPAATAAAIADAAATVIVIVRTLPQVETVLFGAEGLLSRPRPGLVVVLMSTIDPSAMAELAGRASGLGATLVDAPVSGGVAGARAGTLSIMLSGDAGAIERVRPLLERLGSRLFPIGPEPGQAQAVKLANQLMLAAHVIGTLEGLNIARQSGVAIETALPVIAASTGSSWSVEHFDIVRAYWELDDPARGPVGIILKDLTSIGREGAARGLDLPLAGLALEKLRDAWARSGLE
ncbi:MAG: NAD(P)-dependent oxidoreductase [Candidatus Dormibacteraceae bacterium]